MIYLTTHLTDFTLTENESIFPAGKKCALNSAAQTGSMQTIQNIGLTSALREI